MTEPFLSLKMRGFKELKEELQQLPEKTRIKISRKALKESAEVVKQEVVARCPRRNGFLQASIKIRVQVNQNKESALITAGDRVAWYAHLVEYGFTHTSHGEKKADRKPTSAGKIGGKNFMRGSAEAKFEPTVDIFEKTVTETVQQEIGKRKP